MASESEGGRGRSVPHIRVSDYTCIMVCMPVCVCVYLC